MKSLICLLFTMSLVPVAHGWQETSVSAGPETMHIEVALVSAINDIEVPARVKGFINQMEFEEGDVVESGTLIAQLDTTGIRYELGAAMIRKTNAERQASDETPIIYAEATLDVSRKDLEREQSLLQRNAGTRRDYERAQLAVRQSELQVERSKAQQEIDRGAVQLETANIDSVQDLLARHSITAPWSGRQPSANDDDSATAKPLAPASWQIIEISRRSGEFVQEGQTIVRLVDLAEVKVVGHVSSSEYDASQLSGRPVKVTLQLAQGSQVTFDGKIKSIGLEQKLGGLFVVHAVVENQKYGDQWLLRPNVTVSMDIQLQ